MPISKRRKKKGKRVGRGAKIVVDPNKESSITLQDLINVVAYQEAHPEEAAGNKPKIEIVDLTEIKSGPIEAENAIVVDSDTITPGTISNIKEEHDL